MTSSRVLMLAIAVYASIVGAFVYAEIATAGQVGPPIDDGWIYMAFARSLAEGEGITYPGYDGPLCAVTGPAWNALLALMFAVFGATPFVAKSLGVMTGAFAIWATYRLGASASGDRRLGAVAALLLAASPRFVWGSLSVMEVPFFVATVAWGLALHLDRRSGSFGRWLPALVVLWLAGWARPECFVFPVFAVMHRRGVKEFAALVLLIALYPAYHLAAYGHPLPTTFYAKASGGAPWSILARDGLSAALAAAVVNPFKQVLAFVAYLPTYLPMLAFGLYPGLVRAMRSAPGLIFVALAALGFVVARGVLGVAQPSFQYGRYFGHVWVLFAVVALFGFDTRRVAAKPSIIVLGLVTVACLVFEAQAQAYLFDWLPIGSVLTEGDAAWILWTATAFGAVLLLVGARSWERVPRPPVWAVLAFLVVANAFGFARHGRNVADTYTMNVAMAQRIAEVVPEGERVACHDIGAIGFFSNRLALDLAGLGSPEVVFGPRRPNGRIDGQRILTESRPRWLCLTEGMFDAIMGGKQPQLDGLVSIVPHHTIDRPENITLLGTRYHLIELVWN